MLRYQYRISSPNSCLNYRSFFAVSIVTIKATSAILEKTWIEEKSGNKGWQRSRSQEDENELVKS